VSGTFGQLALVLLVCVGCGALAVQLGLPLLVGLLVAGVAVGPEVLGLVAPSTAIELLAEIGISLLLFVVGLKLDTRLVRKLGPVVLVVGTLQVLVTSALAAGIALGFGVALVPSLYLGMAMAFSSTVVVVKVLTDRGEIEQLHGRIALGVLIVQDIIVVALMVVLTSLDPAGPDGLLAQFGLVALKGVALFGAIALLARFVLPRAAHLLARRGELLVLAGVTWAVAVAAAAIALGFSAEVGAFVAGMALASSEYREAINGRLSTIRDFLLVFFFIDLGTRLTFEGADDLSLIVALSVFVLVAKPVAVALITTWLGFPSRTGTRAGLTLAQISEFSLILAALGVSLGHIEGRIAGVATGVALITITVSTLLIARADELTPRLAAPFERLQRNQLRGEHTTRETTTPTVIVLGLGRLGRELVEELLAVGEDVLGVDYDPQLVRAVAGSLPVRFGDTADPELPGQLPLQRARWVVSTPRDPDAHRILLVALRRAGYDGHVAVAVDHEADEGPLRDLGADLVLRPLHVAAGPLMAAIHAHDRQAVPRLIE
jgi:Kef-type K+ transport system membrane component KefB